MRRIGGRDTPEERGVNLTTAAALVFAGASTVVVAFQIGLTVGAPWGAYAMGGTFPGRLPPAMRVAAAVQAVVLAFLAIVVLSEADIVLPALSEAVPWLIWLAVAFSAVSVVLNAITRSPLERRTWLPVALVMFASSLAVAL